MAPNNSQRAFTYISSFPTKKTSQDHPIQPSWKTDVKRSSEFPKFTLLVNSGPKNQRERKGNRGINFKEAKSFNLGKDD